MFARKMGMHGLLFCIFWVIIGLSIDLPLAKVAHKLCNGNEMLEKYFCLIVCSLTAGAMVKLVGSPIIDFFEMITGMRFIR